MWVGFTHFKLISQNVILFNIMIDPWETWAWTAWLYLWITFFSVNMYYMIWLIESGDVEGRMQQGDCKVKHELMWRGQCP